MWLKSLANQSSAVSKRELETEQNLMKDLFNRALRMSQSSGEEKLNFRHAGRHMLGMFNGKATEYTEYIFKIGGLLEHTRSSRERS